MAMIMWRNVAGITDMAISIQKSGATAKERECVHSEGLYHPADVKPYGYKNRITGCRKQICGVCHVSAFLRNTDGVEAFYGKQGKG